MIPVAGVNECRTTKIPLDGDPVPQLRVQRAVADLGEVILAVPADVAVHRLQAAPLRLAIRGVTPDRQERRKSAAHAAIEKVAFEPAGAVDGRGHRDQGHFIERRGPECAAQDAARVPAEIPQHCRPVPRSHPPC